MGFGQTWSAEDKHCYGNMGGLRTINVAFCGHWCSLRTQRVLLWLQGLNEAHKCVVVHL